MANENRNMPAQQGDHDKMGSNESDERIRGGEDVRGIANGSEEDFEDSEESDDEEEEEEEEGEGSF